MFFLQRPSQVQIQSFLASQRKCGFSYAEVGATRGALPEGYIHDHNRVRLGQGPDVFRSAVKAIQTWQMFKLGWADLVDSDTPIESGETVAAFFRHFGFWSLNSCRVVYVINEERRFGFAYGTLPGHAEQGEERFSVDWSSEGDVVSYDILAFSRPRQWQARFAAPISRMLQKKFVRDSKAAMVRAAQAPLRV
jgi:uncharacterized protein (UPF0548 family)